jgi:hypothetical protein
MPTREEKDQFSLMIEERAIKLSVTHMDAIIDYCSKSGMEVEVAASLLNTTIKSKIELEARELRFLPRTGQLPL